MKPTVLSPYVYECRDGYNFTVRIENDKVWLFLPGRTVILPQVTSPDGSKFSNGHITFQLTENLAILNTGQEVYNHCRNNRAKAIWEDAKLCGVSFRAVGNEPGWHVEIIHGAQTVYIGDYGMTRYKFNTPDPLIDQEERTTTYQTQADGHAVTIVLQSQPCLDTMSGEMFDVTVTVILDGRELRGCGRALH